MHYIIWRTQTVVLHAGSFASIHTLIFVIFGRLYIICISGPQNWPFMFTTIIERAHLYTRGGWSQILIEHICHRLLYRNIVLLVQHSYPNLLLLLYNYADQPAESAKIIHCIWCVIIECAFHENCDQAPLYTVLGIVNRVWSCSISTSKMKSLFLFW